MRTAVNAPHTLSATLITTLLSATAGMALVGCDRAALAERETKEAIQQAVLDLHSASGNGATAAKSQLEKISNDLGSSPAARTHSKAMLGQLQYDTAVSLIHDVDQKEMELSRLGFELSQLGVQLDIGALLATDYAKYDPKAARVKIIAQVADANGSADKQVWEYQGVSLPTLSAVKQKISGLEGDIAKLQDQVKALEAQRTTAQTDADSADLAADAAKGQESLDAFKKASGLRHKAADLYTQVDQTNASMQPLQRELSITQGQEKVVNDVITQLNTQAAALDSGWKAIEEKIGAQKDLAQKIVGSSAGSVSASAEGKQAPPVTVSEKVAGMARIASEIRDLRGKAQSSLDESAKLFDDANKAAVDLQTALGTKLNAPGNQNRPERESWEKVKKVMDPQFYKLREASVYRTLGSLHTSDAVSLANREQLAAAVGPTIERAGATIPNEFRAGQFKNSQSLTLADAAYKQSHDLLQDVLSGATADENTKQAATVEDILVLYGWAQVEKMNGSSGDAKTHLEAAVSARNNAAANNVRLPSMPVELGLPPAPAGETPPATQPADGSAPTAPPTDSPTTVPADAPAPPSAPDAAPPTTDPAATPPAAGGANAPG